GLLSSRHSYDAIGQRLHSLGVGKRSAIKKLLQSASLSQQLPRTCISLQERLEAFTGSFGPPFRASAMHLEVRLEGRQFSRVLVDCHVSTLLRSLSRHIREKLPPFILERCLQRPTRPPQKGFHRLIRNTHHLTDLDVAQPLVMEQRKGEPLPLGKLFQRLVHPR